MTIILNINLIHINKHLILKLPKIRYCLYEKKKNNLWSDNEILSYYGRISDYLKFTSIFTMKNVKLFTVCMTILFLFSTQGCQKDVLTDQKSAQTTADLVRNFVSDSWFSKASRFYKPSHDGKLQSRTRLGQVDAVKDFFFLNTPVILHLVNTIGYPVWSESISSEKDGDELLILPFSKLDTNRIDAIMMIHRLAGSESMYFKTIRRNELYNLPNVSALSPDENEKYSELSREFATTMVLYFEYTIFTEVDCDLANATFENPLNEPILESRGIRCYLRAIVYGTSWHVYFPDGSGYYDTTFSYTWQIICDQIMDPGGFAGSGGSNWGYDPGGSTGSGNNNNNNNNNNNENNSGPTLADCRQSNPDVFNFIYNLDDLEIESACTNKTIKLNILNIEKKICEDGKYNLDNLWIEINNYIPDPEINCIKYFGKRLNDCEVELAKKNKIAALQIDVFSKLAQKITIDMFGTEASLWLDCGDAFRHGFFNALMASVLGRDLAKQFSDAHECGKNDNDAIMDLHNNSIGHSIGELFPMNYYAVIKGYYEVLADQVCIKLESGHMKILENINDPNSKLIKSFNCKCN